MLQRELGIDTYFLENKLAIQTKYHKAVKTFDLFSF